MKNLRLLLLIVFFSFSGIQCFSQEEDIPGGEKVEALRVSVYTYTLALTPDEAKVFWPVFNKYQLELKEIKKEEKKLKKQVYENMGTMTDKELTEAIDKLLGYEEQEIQLKKKYTEEFKKVLPIRKVILLPKAELEFKKLLLNKIKEKKGGR